MSSPSPNPEKALIIHSGAIGDLLLALPAMRLFRQAFRRCGLHLMGYPERLALVASDLEAESIHSIDRAGMAFFYSDNAPLPPPLCSFFSSFRIILAFGQKGVQTLAKNLERAGTGRVLILPSFPPEGLTIHVSHFHLASLRKNGIEGEAPDCPLELPKEALNFSANYWARSGIKDHDRILAIHPGSGNPAKNWSPGHFAEIADWASGRAKVLMICGPARDGVEEVSGLLKKSTPLIAQNLPLVQLAAVMKRCTAYLGNDSGITHLAANLGLPTVALFGPTDPLVWGPRGSRVRILFAKRPVPSDLPKARDHGEIPGSIQIEPQKVIEELSALLG